MTALRTSLDVADWPIARPRGRSGWATVLDGLHDSLAWSDSGVDLESPDPTSDATTATVLFAEDGLLLVPSVFVGAGVAAHLDGWWPKTLIYPARGAAALWSTPSRPETDALASLMGRSRTRLLAKLETPASTTHLARGLGMAVGAVATISRSSEEPGSSSGPDPADLSFYGRMRWATPSCAATSRPRATHVELLQLGRPCTDTPGCALPTW